MTVNENQINQEIIINQIVKQDNLVKSSEVVKKFFEDFIIRKNIRTKTLLFLEKYYNDKWSNGLDWLTKYLIEYLENSKDENLSLDQYLLKVNRNKYGRIIIESEIIYLALQKNIIFSNKLFDEIILDLTNDIKSESGQISNSFDEDNNLIENPNTYGRMQESFSQSNQNLLEFKKLKEYNNFLIKNGKSIIDWKKTAENIYNYYNY